MIDIDNYTVHNNNNNNKKMVSIMITEIMTVLMISTITN